jgi:uncharacterized membrane protein
MVPQRRRQKGRDHAGRRETLGRSIEGEEVSPESEGEKVTQSRWKSWVVWMTVASQLVAILIALEVISVSQQDVINKVVAAVLQLLVTFGILNNPTDKANF